MVLLTFLSITCRFWLLCFVSVFRFCRWLNSWTGEAREGRRQKKAETEAWLTQRNEFIKQQEERGERVQNLEDLAFRESQFLKSQTLRNVQREQDPLPALWDDVTIDPRTGRPYRGCFEQEMDNVRQRVQNGTRYNTPWSPYTEPPDLHSLIQNNTTTPGYPVAGRQSHNFEAPNHHLSHRAYNSSRHVTNYNTSSTPVYPMTIRSPPCPSSSSNYQSHHSHNSSTLPSAYPARHYLWTREKCLHSVLWDKVDIEGRESCEKCHRNRKFILQCPQCGIKACGSCQADLRPKGWKVSVMRQVAKQSHQNHIDTLIMRDRDFLRSLKSDVPQISRSSLAPTPLLLGRFVAIYFGGEKRSIQKNVDAAILRGDICLFVRGASSGLVRFVMMC